MCSHLIGGWSQNVKTKSVNQSDTFLHKHFYINNSYKMNFDTRNGYIVHTIYLP